MYSEGTTTALRDTSAYDAVLHTAAQSFECHHVDVKLILTVRTGTNCRSYNVTIPNRETGADAEMRTNCTLRGQRAREPPRPESRRYCSQQRYTATTRMRGARVRTREYMLESAFFGLDGRL